MGFFVFKRKAPKGLNTVDDIKSCITLMTLNYWELWDLGFRV